jgi:hypothetical protein
MNPELNNALVKYNHTVITPEQLAKEFGYTNAKKLKPSKWRQVLKNIAAAANSIDRIKWQR